MSVETIQRLHAQYEAGVEEACSSGRGAEHLLSHFRATGRDFAAAIFLQMTTALEGATETTAPTVFAWAQGFPEVAAGIAADTVRGGLVQFGLDRSEFGDEAVAAAFGAFADELDRLFETAEPGGSA